MISYDKIQKGVAAYLDNEVMPAFKDEGWKRVVAGSAIALVIQRSDKFLPLIVNNQMVRALELVDENGNFDIDAIVPVLKQQLSNQPMDINVPMLGKLTFNSSDVDKLVDYISVVK